MFFMDENFDQEAFDEEIDRWLQMTSKEEAEENAEYEACAAYYEEQDDLDDSDRFMKAEDYCHDGACDGNCKYCTDKLYAKLFEEACLETNEELKKIQIRRTPYL